MYKRQSQQTDLSHFHRENDSQVYLPAIKTTQTTKESGSQHARTVQYVGGLRGNDFTTGAPVKLQYAKTAKATPGVVDLTYDLTSNLKPVAVGPSPGHLP